MSKRIVTFNQHPCICCNSPADSFDMFCPHCQIEWGIHHNYLLSVNKGNIDFYYEQENFIKQKKFKCFLQKASKK